MLKMEPFVQKQDIRRIKDFPLRSPATGVIDCNHGPVRQCIFRWLLHTSGDVMHHKDDGWWFALPGPSKWSLNNPCGLFSPLQQYQNHWPSPETTESAWLSLECCLSQFLIMTFISHWLNSLWCSSCRQSSVWADIMKLVNTIKCESICCRSCSLNIPGESRIPALVLALPLNMIVTLGKALQFASP